MRYAEKWSMLAMDNENFAVRMMSRTDNGVVYRKEDIDCHGKFSSSKC
jgi:hypothetical protein